MNDSTPVTEVPAADTDRSADGVGYQTSVTEVPATDPDHSGDETEVPASDPDHSGGETEVPATDPDHSGDETEVPATDPDHSGDGVGHQHPVVDVLAAAKASCKRRRVLNAHSGIFESESSEFESECRNPRRLVLNAESGLFESDDCESDCDGESIIVSGTTNTSSVIDLLPVRYMLFKYIKNLLVYNTV